MRGDILFDALLLNAGYNAALVSIGAALLAGAAGGVGAFLFLRRRALISDAVAHATLPGVALAFLAMVALGGDGRSLIGLTFGAAATALLGFLAVEWIARRTRLGEDAAIGAVLSVFFGAGIVLLTVIQSLSVGRQAGLEDFLFGSAAGMLFEDAALIAGGGAALAAAVYALRRPMALIAFDPGYAAASGVDVRRTDLAMMALGAAVIVIGIKIVGLLLIVALLIIPPVAARFWTDRVDQVAVIGAAIGAASAYLGAALSAAAPNLPTGAVIVLIAFAVCMLSLLLAPRRGVLAAALRWRAFQRRVHLRQGLLALARGEPIYDGLTLRVLRRAGLIHGDGVPTEAGRAEAARALFDERRWETARRLRGDEPGFGAADGLAPIETVLTPDEIAAVDAATAPLAPAEEHER
ncbi:MAG: metal ABC transporter permease [Pseudomonadota bacterium]